jgi:LuxR family maltose regulon positive regulatory protein
MVAVLATLIYAWMGRPVEAERWADAVDRWQYGEAARPDDPGTEAWAALARALLCRRGISRMLADAEEAADGFAAEGIVTSGPALLQAVANVLAGDLDDGDALLKDAVRLGEKTGAHEIIAQALSERSMLAMARGEWIQAEALAGQARTALRKAGIEESYVTPLVCAAQARVALHSGDVPAARQEVVRAQRARPLLSRATPHVAVQARVELARVHLALADVAGARTLMREIDELLKRRPDLGTLVGEAQALRTQLSAEHTPSVPGASSLTGAELRVLPMLATHLSFPEIGADLFLSPHTVKSQAMSIYRKLGASSRSEAVTRSRELGLLEA